MDLRGRAIRTAWSAATIALLGAAACTSPCEEYCEAFAEKTADCRLGGPGGDVFVDACTTEVERQVTGDQCTLARHEIERQSCEQFRESVCAQSGADTVYDCDGVDPSGSSSSSAGGSTSSSSSSTGSGGAGGGGTGFFPGDPSPCLTGGRVLHVEADRGLSYLSGLVTSDDTWTWSSGSDPAQFGASALPPGIQPGDFGQWNVNFSLHPLGPGEVLEIGAYDDARRDQGPVPGYPELFACVNGAGCCNTTRGRFDVYDIETVGETITRFTATFEIHCEPMPGVIDPAGLHGCVHYE